jgi:hypothetical protein
MNPPNLNIEQRKAIKLATKQEIEAWMDEIYPAIGDNLELKQLYYLLNDYRGKRKDVN